MDNKTSVNLSVPGSESWKHLRSPNTSFSLGSAPSGTALIATRAFVWKVRSFQERHSTLRVSGAAWQPKRSRSFLHCFVFQNDPWGFH